MRQHKRLPSEPTQPREKREKVCADKFQNMACIYFYEDRKITIRIQIKTFVLSYLYFEIKRAFNLKKEQEKELHGGS